MNETTSCTAILRPDGYGIQKHTGLEGAPWYRGHVRTPDGFVTVYSEASVTTLCFIRNGREYFRQYERGFQPRHLVTLASRFAKELESKP